jgi:hypothetical protein
VAKAAEYFGTKTSILVLNALPASAMLLNMLKSQNGNSP